MKTQLAKAYILLSGLILVAVGIAGFFLHEMFNLTFPPAHNLFHLLSGLIALISFSRPNGPRLFGLLFGSIYTLLAFAGFLGLHDLGPIQLGLNIHYNFIHLGLGLFSLLAGFVLAKPPIPADSTPRRRDAPAYLLSFPSLNNYIDNFTFLCYHLL